MSGNRPSHRIVFKTKDGQRFDVAVIWPPKKAMDGLLGSLSPQKTNEDGKFKKMAMDEALRRVANGEGYLDVWSTERGAPKPQHTGGDYGGSDPMGDDSIPFAPKDDRIL